MATADKTTHTKSTEGQTDNSDIVNTSNEGASTSGIENESNDEVFILEVLQQWKQMQRGATVAGTKAISFVDSSYTKIQGGTLGIIHPLCSI